MNISRTANLFATVMVTVLLALLPRAGFATQMTLEPSSSGDISREHVVTIDGQFYFYGTSNPLTELRYSPFAPIGMVRSSILDRGYLLFDVSALSFLVESAAIDFDLGYARSASPKLTVTSLSAVQTQALTEIPPEDEYYSYYDALFGTPEQQANYSRAASAYNAIGSGTPLGTLSDPGPLSGLYTVALNAAALNFINGSTGLIGLGLTWTPTVDLLQDPFIGWYESGSDHLSFNAEPRLHLSGSANTVPLPGTFALVAVAILLLPATTHRRGLHPSRITRWT